MPPASRSAGIDPWLFLGTLEGDDLLRCLAIDLQLWKLMEPALFEKHSTATRFNKAYWRWETLRGREQLLIKNSNYCPLISFTAL